MRSTRSRDRRLPRKLCVLVLLGLGFPSTGCIQQLMGMGMGCMPGMGSTPAPSSSSTSSTSAKPPAGGMGCMPQMSGLPTSTSPSTTNSPAGSTTVNGSTKSPFPNPTQPTQGAPANNPGPIVQGPPPGFPGNPIPISPSGGQPQAPATAGVTSSMGLPPQPGESLAAPVPYRTDSLARYLRLAN